MSRQGGKRRVAQVQADQQHIGQDLEVGTWEDCIEINSYIVNTNTSLTKSGLSNKRTMWKDPPNQIAIFTLFRLADTDADGLLDDEEFALAQHLIKVTIRVCTFCNSAFPLACLHFFIVCLTLLKANWLIFFNLNTLSAEDRRTHHSWFTASSSDPPQVSKQSHQDF